MSRIAAALCIKDKPDVGCAYVCIDLEATKKNDGQKIYVHVSTTCRRDVDPKHGGDPKLAPLTGYSAKEPFFKAKIGKKPNFQYITFLCGQDRSKCVSKCGRYEWTGVKKKEAPSTWNVTTNKEIAQAAKEAKSAQARAAALKGAAKRKAASKSTKKAASKSTKNADSKSTKKATSKKTSTKQADSKK